MTWHMRVFLGLVLAFATIWLLVTATFAQVGSNVTFVPLISNSGVPIASATPALTSTPVSGTSTPVPSLTPTATATPTLPDPSFDNCQEDPNPSSAPNYPVRLVNVVKDANPEVVQLQNMSATSIDLTGWHVCSINGNQEHVGISGVLDAGEMKSFPYKGSGFIWNNSERDDGALYNDAGQLVSYWIDPTTKLTIGAGDPHLRAR